MTRKQPYIAILGISPGQSCIGCGGPTIEDKDKPFPTVGSTLMLARVNVNANLAFSLCLPCLDLLGLEIKEVFKRERQMCRPVKKTKPKPVTPQARHDTPEVVSAPGSGPVDFLFEGHEESPAAVVKQPSPASRPGEWAIGTRVYTKDVGIPDTDWTFTSAKRRRFGVMGTIVAVHQQPILYYVRHDGRPREGVGAPSTVAFYVPDELDELGPGPKLALGTRVRTTDGGVGIIMSFGQSDGHDIYGIEFDAGGVAGFGPQDIQVLAP